MNECDQQDWQTGMTFPAVQSRSAGGLPFLPACSIPGNMPLSAFVHLESIWPGGFPCCRLWNRDGPCKVHQSEDSSYHPRATWLTSWAELARGCSRHPMPVGAGPPTSPSSTARIDESTRPTATLASPQPFRQRQMQVCHLWSALALHSASCLCANYGINHTLTRERSGGYGPATTPSLHAAAAAPLSRPLVRRLHHTAPDHLRPLVTAIATQVLCWPSHSMMTERAHQPIFKSTIHHRLCREGSRAFSAPHSWDVDKAHICALVTARLIHRVLTKQRSRVF